MILTDHGEEDLARGASFDGKADCEVPSAKVHGATDD